MARSQQDWAALLAEYPAVTVEYPFGPESRVVKAGGKMFALLTEDEEPPRITLKADPERSEEWRAIYPDHVLPGYYMNKRHWNTVRLDGAIPEEEVVEMIDHSFDRVVAGLPKTERPRFLRVPSRES
ncbi:MAG: MmcQ/YjbR family DNA-binding protein [Capsulimonadales bacterium]|nr:MmcQ/YjbR family DNA-binding protein [Capsulimonadales bacterium]